MAKKEHAKGLWISPTGRRHRRVRGLAKDLIGRGWTRYRRVGGAHHFQVDDGRRRVSVIESVLVLVEVRPWERLVVSQRLDPRTFRGTVGDFFERVFFRLSKKIAKPDPWAWTRIDGALQ